MKKKTLIILVLVFLGSFILTYSFLKKDKTVPKLVLAEHIPISNNIIGTIDYAAIEGVVQTEMFRNPLQLLDMKNNFEEDPFFADVIGGLIQGGIDKDQKIIFSIANKIEEGSFLLIAVDDYKRVKKKLTKKIANYPQQKLEISKNVTGSFYTNDTIGVVFDDNFLLIAYSEKNEVLQLWENITSKKGCYSENEAGIDSIINNEHHISVWANLNKKDDEVFVHVDFKDGKLLISSSVITKNDYLKAAPSSGYVCDSCATSFHLNMSNLNKLPALLNDSIRLQLDSLTQLLNIDVQQAFNLSNGRIDAVIIDKGVRKDRIITYEFDDDFNKVKREKVLAFPVVNFIMTLGNIEDEMYCQFKKKGVIKEVEDEELFTNPLGKCFVKKEVNQLKLTSNKDLFDETIKVEKISQPLFLKVNIDKLLESFSKYDTIIAQPFNSLLCKAAQKDTLISIHLELIAKKSDRNILFDIVEVAASKR